MATEQLSSADYLQFLRIESSKLLAVKSDQLELEVGHLDGWNVQKLLTHTGQVLRYAALCLNSQPADSGSVDSGSVDSGSLNLPDRSEVSIPPEDDSIIGWFADSADVLLVVLDGVDARSMTPTWLGPQPASWWFRRLAHEVAIHRWDVQRAWMNPEPIDARFAVDGIDELLEVHVAAKLDLQKLGGSGETVHLHATDIESGEWLLTYGADGVACEHAHAKGDVAARGTASDLLLMMWGRVPPERLEVFGDVSLLHRWQAAATF